MTFWTLLAPNTESIFESGKWGARVLIGSSALAKALPKLLLWMWLSRAGAQGCWCARWGSGKGVSITFGKLIGFCSETFKNINLICLFHFQKTRTMVWSTIYDTDKVRGELWSVYLILSTCPNQLLSRKLDIFCRIKFVYILICFIYCTVIMLQGFLFVDPLLFCVMTVVLHCVIVIACITSN